MACEGVQLAAHRVHLLGDLAAPVRFPVPLNTMCSRKWLSPASVGGLILRAGAEPQPHGHGSEVRDARSPTTLRRPPGKRRSDQNDIVRSPCMRIGHTSCMPIPQQRLFENRAQSRRSGRDGRGRRPPRPPRSPSRRGRTAHRHGFIVVYNVRCARRLMRPCDHRSPPRGTPAFIADVDHVLDLVHALVRQLGDVDHAVLAGRIFDERAEGT